MRIMIVSDAWTPQVNGVVRTLRTTVTRLAARGHEVATITPDQFRSIPCPTYPDIRLAIGAGGGVARRLDACAPEAIHIATEGPLGWAARRWCRRRGLPFTTSFHTRFPDYIAARTGLPAALFWPTLVRFHRPASAIFVATASLSDELASHGLRQTHRWSRGVDLEQFSGNVAPLVRLAELPRPIQLYVGRVAVEKNVDDFLATRVGGSKVVVGDGPLRRSLEQRHPDALFTGVLHGETLAAAYAAADVFVFPSRTDTFGLVIVEALASGVPVAAYRVPGPLDIIGRNGCGASGKAPVGALDERLDVAVVRALAARPADCRAEGASYDWDRCTDQFFAGLKRVASPAPTGCGAEGAAVVEREAITSQGMFA